MGDGFIRVAKFSKTHLTEEKKAHGDIKSSAEEGMWMTSAAWFAKVVMKTTWMLCGFSFVVKSEYNDFKSVLSC